MESREPGPVSSLQAASRRVLGFGTVSVLLHERGPTCFSLGLVDACLWTFLNITLVSCHCHLRLLHHSGALLFSASAKRTRFLLLAADRPVSAAFRLGIWPRLCTLRCALGAACRVATWLQRRHEQTSPQDQNHGFSAHTGHGLEHIFSGMWCEMNHNKARVSCPQPARACV